MEGSSVINISADTFQSDVVERSESLPIFVLFWAEQVEPSVHVKALLEQLIGQYQGKAGLALSDVSLDQSLAQTLRVQGLPSIRVVFKGKIVEQIDGPCEEAQLRDLLDRLTQSPADLLKDQLSGLLAESDWDVALALVQEALEEEPNNQGFRVELADLLVRKGETEEAGKVLSAIPDDVETRKRPLARLAFVEESATLPSAEELDQMEAEGSKRVEILYCRAVALVIDGHFEDALDLCLEILSTDRKYRDDIGRITMIRIFDLLDKGSELSSTYRRKMFNFMH